MPVNPMELETIYSLSKFSMYNSKRTQIKVTIGH